MNIALQVLEELGEDLDEYRGYCGELADAIMHRYPNAQILYVKPRKDWEDLAIGDDICRYHMAAVVDGIVHDAWFPELLLPPDRYVKQAFPNVKTVFDLHS